jgi:hypothetical protein
LLLTGGVMRCAMVWCGMVWRGVAWCGVVWCGVVWCVVVLVGLVCRRMLGVLYVVVHEGDFAQAAALSVVCVEGVGRHNVRMCFGAPQA